MRKLRIFFLITLMLCACNFPGFHTSINPINSPSATLPPHRADFTLPAPTPSPSTATVIKTYHLGDTIPYESQAGDTLPNLAGRFRTTTAEILAINPAFQTTPPISFLAPDTVVQIKLKQEPDWGATQRLLPDALFVNGPAEVGFNWVQFVKQNPGWLKNYVDNSSGNHVSGVQIVRDITLDYSISPRLILALLEYQLHALSDPAFPPSYSLGNQDGTRKAFTSQISWMANTLNNGFYGWQDGKLASLSSAKASLNPWQNSASTALLYYFSQVQPAVPDKNTAGEFVAIYQHYFGTIDWNAAQTRSLLPAGLTQPKLSLPFEPNLQKWSYTGGPHAGWGVGDPLAAVDFAPPAETSGCDPSPEWALAVADGVIARADDGLVFYDLNLDGDSNYQTGWAIQYLHLLPTSVPGPGTHLRQGDPIGHPSCAGVHATGRHVHIARLYNGVWISATEALPFVLDGWEVIAGAKEYDGLLKRGDVTVSSSIYGEHGSQIPADPKN